MSSPKKPARRRPARPGRGKALGEGARSQVRRNKLPPAFRAAGRPEPGPGAGTDGNGGFIGICILAGGQSSRMGRDKSRLRLGRRSLLAHTRAAAKEIGLKVRVIRKDLIGQCGPLSGIYTALKSSRGEAELFLACDMPFVPASLLRRVIRGLRRRDQGCFATVNRLAGFPFLIRARCADLVRKEILRGRLSLQSLATKLSARRVPIPPPERGGLLNVNTPADFKTARRRLSRNPAKTK